MEVWDGAAFNGAKAALLCDDRLAVLRRDDLPGLPYAGMIDLPGGGREGAETPVETVLRETEEEIGLSLSGAIFHHARSFDTSGGARVWFFVGTITTAQCRMMRLGDEGQACWMMPVADFLAAPDAIPPMTERLRAALA